MKLGDRKRLTNHIKYLQSIYNKSKEKLVQTKKKKTSNKNPNNTHKKYMSKQLHSVQNPIK